MIDVFFQILSAFSLFGPLTFIEITVKEGKKAFLIRNMELTMFTCTLYSDYLSELRLRQKYQKTYSQTESIRFHRSLKYTSFAYLLF